MTSPNYYETQIDHQFPKVFTNTYYGNDESNFDEYDNIDCDLLLEFFGGESTGPPRVGYDNNSYNRLSPTFPGRADGSTSATGPSELNAMVRSNEQMFDTVKCEIDQKGIVNDVGGSPVPKSKKQKVSNELQSNMSNQELMMTGRSEIGTHGKNPSTSKNAISKVIQLEASKDRRRERNKVLARKTRCKKKAEFETLRKQLLKLRTENDRLKELVKGTMPNPVTAKTLLGCDVQLPEDVAEVVQTMIRKIEAADSNLLALVNPSQRSFCITNALAADNPIVYASPGFMELTGYDMHGILGHNCRILQGKDTDRDEVRKLRVAVEQGREEQVIIKNYRRDGSTYWSRVQIAPMRDSAGRVTLIVSVQYEVPGPTTAAFSTAISSDMSGLYTSMDGTSTDGSSAVPMSSSSEGSQTSSSRSCASFADDRSGSCSGSTSGGGSSSSGYSSNDNRSTDGVSDQGDSN